MNNNELEKIKLLLEEKDFEQAKDMLDELISIDYKNSKAYLYLLLIKYKVSNIDELINLATPINHEKLFILSYKYADSFEKQQLNELCKNIENKIEDIKLSKYYEEALVHFHNNEYERSMKEFGYLNNYKDSKIYFEKAKDAILNEKYVHAENLLVQGQISEAILIFYELKDYKDSGERYLELKKKRDAEGNYNLAIQECSSNAPDQIKRGIMRLRTLENYKESEILITQYTRKLLQIEHEEDIKLQQNKKRNRTLLVVIILLFSLLVGIVSLITPAYRYNNAMQYLESGDFQQAKEAFLDLGNYRDSEKYVIDIDTYFALVNEEYTKAIDIYSANNRKIIINYHSNGAKEGELITEEITNVSELRTDFMKEGYVFSRHIYKDGKIDFNKHTLTIDIDILWTYVRYNIHLKLNGGYISCPRSYGMEDEVRIGSPTKNGFAFLGWKSANSDELMDEIYIPKGSKGDVYYEAFWEKEIYELKFYINDQLAETINVSYSEYFVFPDSQKVGNKEIVQWELNGSLYNPGVKIEYDYSKSNEVRAIIEYVNNDFSYVIENTSLYITGILDLSQEEALIPRYYKINNIYYKVYGIKEGSFVNNANLKSIYVPSSISMVETGAFSNCPNLTIYVSDEDSTSRWKDNWNGDIPVLYGYELDDFIK